MYIKNCIALPNYIIIVLFSNNRVEILNIKDEIFGGYAKDLRNLDTFLNIKFTKNHLYWGKDQFESILDIHVDQIIKNL